MTQVHSLSQNQWSGWIRYGLPGIVLGIVISAAFQGWGVKAQAEQGTGTRAGAGTASVAAERPRPALDGGLGNATTGAGNGTIAFTTLVGPGSSSNGSGSAQLLYVIDTKSKALAIYKVDPTNTNGTLKLEATRQYQWDLKLAEYNNLEPTVAAIESTVSGGSGQPNR